MYTVSIIKFLGRILNGKYTMRVVVGDDCFLRYKLLAFCCWVVHIESVCLIFLKMKNFIVYDLFLA